MKIIKTDRLWYLRITDDGDGFTKIKEKHEGRELDSSEYVNAAIIPPEALDELIIELTKRRDKLRKSGVLNE